MKRTKNKIVALLLSAVTAASLAACGTPDATFDDNPLNNEQINTSKTQLYVNNFYGGYGSDWLAAAKARYEELHKDDVYETGKKGVQIYVNNKKKSANEDMSNILDNRDEIYFSEYSYYRTLLAEGILGDITDAVTGDLEPYGDAAGSTIEKKLTAQQQEFYGVQEGNATHYYGLPHYAGYTGIIYNIDLFESKGYYFVEGYESQSGTRRFQGSKYKNLKKSAGIDGISGTDDDGLPTTYDEFKELIKFIYDGGDTPIVWNGKNHQDYLTFFMQSLATDFEGLDQWMLNYNLGSGTVKQATNLGRISGGQFVRDAEPTTITDANGYDTMRQQGKYEGLNLVRWLEDNDNDKYHNNLAFNSAYSHTDMQEDFLLAGVDGVTAPIAMLVEGVWWESEATSVFKSNASKYGEEYSKNNRHFGFMPLPKANADKVQEARDSGTKQTLIDHIYSICFMKKNVSEWKKPLALDFIKFVHTDESLAEFTTITNTPKAFEYEMTDDQLAEMSPFGQSVMKLKAASDVVYPYSTNKVFIQNQSSFNAADLYAIGTTVKYPAGELREKQTSAADYFTKMCTYYKNGWSDKLK